MAKTDDSEQSEVTDKLEEFETSPENLDKDEFEEINVEDHGFELPRADFLSDENVRKMLLAYPVRRVSVVGSIDSGKTTLISELYAQFLIGKFAGFSFAGSLTLAGFEERLHLSRATSGRTSPDTARTSINDPLAYLHLRLADGGSAFHNLAISDRAGEAYRTLFSQTDPSLYPPELSSSQHLSFLIDGKRLSDAAECNNALEIPRNLFRKLLDTETISQNQSVSFVVTKVDLFLGQNDEKRVTDLLACFMERYQQFQDRVRSIDLFQTSVRREPNSLADIQIPLGIDQLLQHWLEPIKPIVVPPANPTLVREFDRLMTRGLIMEQIQ